MKFLSFKLFISLMQRLTKTFLLREIGVEIFNRLVVFDPEFSNSNPKAEFGFLGVENCHKHSE